MWIELLEKNIPQTNHINNYCRHSLGKHQFNLSAYNQEISFTSVFLKATNVQMPFMNSERYVPCTLSTKTVPQYFQADT